MAMAMTMEPDIAPAMASSETVAISPAAEAVSAGAPRQRRGFLRRMMPRTGRYSPVGVEALAADGDAEEKRPRQSGWVRRLVVPGEQCARGQRLGRGWKELGGGASRLARSLRWKRLSGLSASLRGGNGWAAALLDAVAFRVMYVVEAVVLGLALSCFFCCCGCQI